MSLELGVNTKTVWEAIKDVVIKTIIWYGIACLFNYPT